MIYNIIEVVKKIYVNVIKKMMIVNGKGGNNNKVSELFGKIYEN